MLRVYMAAGISMRDEVLSRAYQLQGAGIEVTSRWLHEQTRNLTYEGVPDETLAAHAVRDIADIERADVLVYNAHKDPKYRSQGGGAHWETGYAYARDKPVFIAGRGRNVFHFLPFGETGVRRFVNWESTFAALIELRNGGMLNQAEPQLATESLIRYPDAYKNALAASQSHWVDQGDGEVFNASPIEYNVLPDKMRDDFDEWFAQQPPDMQDAVRKAQKALEEERLFNRQQELFLERKKGQFDIDKHSIPMEEPNTSARLHNTGGTDDQEQLAEVAAKHEWIADCERKEDADYQRDPVGWRYMTHAGYRSCKDLWRAKVSREAAGG